MAGGPHVEKLGEIGPPPDDLTVHLDAGYDSGKVRVELAARGMTGEIAGCSAAASAARRKSSPACPRDLARSRYRAERPSGACGLAMPVWAVPRE